MMVEHHHENLTPVLACHFLLHGIRRRDFLFATGGGAGRAGDERVHAVYRYRHVGIDDGALSFFQIHHFAPGERFPGGIIDIYRRAGSGNRLCAVYFVDDYYRADKFHHLGQRCRVFFPQRILGQGRHFAVAECRAVSGMVGV